MRTYSEASEFLGTRQHRRHIGAGRSTWIERRSDVAIAVRYHGTDVVTYYRNGSIELRSGGHHTVTTKRRINQFSPAIVWQQRYAWYLSCPHQYDSVRFFDGIMLGHADGPLRQLPLFAALED